MLVTAIVDALATVRMTGGGALAVAGPPGPVVRMSTTRPRAVAMGPDTTIGAVVGPNVPAWTGCGLRVRIAVAGGRTVGAVMTVGDGVVRTGGSARVERSSSALGGSIGLEPLTTVG